MDMYQNPAMQEKLKAMFGSDQAYREFASSAAAERRLKGFQSVGNGSQTASRLFGAGDLDTEAMKNIAEMGAHAKVGNIAGMVAAGKDAWNTVKTPESVRNEMGRILLSQGEEAKNNLQSLSSVSQLLNQKRARNDQLAGALMSNIINNATNKESK
jgi:hypothetical protein